MVALAYRVTKHTIPGWVPIHDKEPRGLAYETDTHFVHVFGKDRGLMVVSVGLTTTESKSGTLRDWVDRTFGAKDIVELNREIGHTMAGVWRPGLYFYEESLQGLKATSFDVRVAEQSLLLLVQRLDELLNFIEPSINSMATHSHKSRELLLLACMDVENYWSSFLKLAGEQPPRQGFKTSDYVRLCAPLCLEEYEVSLPRYAVVSAMQPFSGWSATKPTQSLSWYDAYNKTKHDKATHFTDATLENCILAVAANLVLFSVRFGPTGLFHGAGTLPAYINQLFSIALRDYDPRTFYVPQLKLPSNQRKDLICFGAQNLVEPWAIDPLRL